MFTTEWLLYTLYSIICIWLYDYMNIKKWHGTIYYDLCLISECNNIKKTTQYISVLCIRPHMPLSGLWGVHLPGLHRQAPSAQPDVLWPWQPSAPFPLQLQLVLHSTDEQAAMLWTFDPPSALCPWPHWPSSAPTAAGPGQGNIFFCILVCSIVLYNQKSNFLLINK